MDKEYNVDQAAQDALWLLAQNGKAGEEQAKHILMKVFKKTSEGHLRKPSAFVSTSVKHAWNELRDTTDGSNKRPFSSRNDIPPHRKQSRFW